MTRGGIAAAVVAGSAFLVPVAAAQVPAPESVLAVVSAARGSLRVDDTGAGTLVLQDAARRAVWFSDRPARDAGTYSLTELADVFFAGDDPPNAALEVASDDEDADVIVLELSEPEVEGRTLRFSVQVIEQPRGRGVDGRLATLAVRADDSVPRTLRDPVVFIDSAVVGNTTCSGDGGNVYELQAIGCADALEVLAAGPAGAACEGPQTPDRAFTTPVGPWECEGAGSPNETQISSWRAAAGNTDTPGARFLWCDGNC